MDYKEKLEEAKRLYETANADQRYVLESLFPELAESEDERVRKALLEMVHDTTGDELWVDYNVHKEDALAWLEKQGEQKPVFEMKTPEESLGINSDTYNKIVDECIYGENKPADIVEPKFKAGDWIVDTLYDKAMQVLFLEDDGYEFENGIWISYTDAKERVHLWTIQDAKDGDVLASKDKEDILIYKSHSIIDLLLTSHISFSKKEGFCPRQYSAWDSNEFIPATKEQRDLLFSKMHEAGYEWDADKKELKKISQRMISAEAKEAMYAKTAWSEEDEKMLKSIISTCELAGQDRDSSPAARHLVEIQTNWLKTLKERYTWKPSDEQMKALHDLNLTGNISYAGQGQTLIELYNDLKKLKGE